MSDTDPELRKSIADLKKDERWADVIAAAKLGLAGDPLDHQLMWDVGWGYFKLGEHEKAAHYLHEAIDHGPVNHAYYATLGAVLSEAGEYDAAELWLLRALAVRDSSFTRLALALVYMKEDLADAAEAVHKEGIRLKPNSRERLKAYANFLSDVGRHDESQKVEDEAKRKGAAK